MSVRFDTDLEALKEKLVTMGDCAQEMFQTAMGALIDRDASGIGRIDQLETRVDQYQVDIDNEVIRMLAVHGPVAMDLRFVLMVARINTELERIGDQACNMIEYVELLLSEPELKRLVDLPRMADTAANMLKKSLAAFVRGDVAKAREVLRSDDVVDALDEQIFRVLLTYMMSDAKNITRAVALLLFARSLERIADHATNIAEQVIYLVEGKDVRHKDVRTA